MFGFFLFPACSPEYCGQAQEETLPAPFLFSVFFFSLSRSRDSKKKIFFTSYTQIGRGFETALTSRRLTNHHIHVDAKGRGIKTIVGNWLERRSRVFYWDTWSACVSYFSM